MTKTYSVGDFAYQSFSNAYVLDLIVTEESTDLEANTSLISYRLQLRSGKNNRFAGRLPCTVSIDGSQVASKTVGIDAYYNHTYVLLNGSVSVPHDTDGKKNLRVQGHISGISGNQYAPPALDIDEIFPLTSIPRASSISATDADIGSISSVSVYKASSGFSHSIFYQFGSLSGYLQANGDISESEAIFSKSAVPFRLPESFYGQIPDARSGTVTLTCKTYSGSAVIGDPVSTTFRANTNMEICAPRVSGTVQDVNPVTVTLTGDKNIMVRYRSTASAVITAKARKQAAIKQRMVNGQASEGTTVLQNVETDLFEFSAVDSRGYSGTAAVRKLLVPYIPLTLNASVKRDSPTGNTAVLTVQGNYYPGKIGAAQNTLSVTFSVVGGVSGTVPVTVDGDSYTGSTAISGVSYDQSYQISMEASDKLDNVPATVQLGQGVPVFDWGKNYFNFNVPVSLNAGMTIPTVIEEGDSGMWHFRKWSNGIAECWGETAPASYDINVPWGGFFQTASPVSPVPYPVNFADIPREWIAGTSEPGVSGGYILTDGNENTKSSTGLVYLTSPTVVRLSGISISFYVFGRWE